MSNHGLDFPLNFANEYAAIYLDDLLPFCKLACVVGSVRRHSRIVHDIEILAIPTLIPTKNLFGESSSSVSMLAEAFPALVKRWSAKVVKDGDKYKKLLMREGLPLDIFISTHERIGVEMVIRTGPADFSKKVVTTRQQGGYLPSDCKIKDGWQVYRGEKLLPMATELDFMNFLGLGWVEPDKRTAELRAK